MECYKCRFHFEIHGKRWCDFHNIALFSRTDCEYGELYDQDELDESKIKTNGDILRDKTDEELANLFKNYMCPFVFGYDGSCNTKDGCYNCWVNWLKNSAETKNS